MIIEADIKVDGIGKVHIYIELTSSEPQPNSQENVKLTTSAELSSANKYWYEALQGQGLF